MRSVWRAEDEALLARLADEEILARLWERAAPGAEPLHPRAAGMIRMLAARPGGAEAVARAEAGDTGPLLGLATPTRLRAEGGAGAWAPELVHHLALFHRARARHLAGRPRSGPARDAAAVAAAETRSLQLVIACWLALGAGGRDGYLGALARDVIGGALPEDAIERAARDAATRGIDAVAAAAREGAEARSAGGAVALAVLAGVEEAIRIAAVDGELAARARSRAQAAHAAIALAVLEPIAVELEELSAREWKPDEVASALARATEAWRWAGEDAEIERFVARELPRFAWDLYRGKRWDDLRGLLRAIEAPSDRMARRIEEDPAQIAWAAQCAQLLVFRAELAPTLDTQLVLAERGHRLCPSLRNARLVLADLLCARAERRLEQPVLLRGADAWAAARRDVDRAGEIFPELARLAALRERLARRGAA